TRPAKNLFSLFARGQALHVMKHRIPEFFMICPDRLEPLLKCREVFSDSALLDSFSYLTAYFLIGQSLTAGHAVKYIAENVSSYTPKHEGQIRRDISPTHECNCT